MLSPCSCLRPSGNAYGVQWPYHFSKPDDGPVFHITIVQIGVFDWLSGRQKASIFIKMFKNLLRNHMEDEAETWHTCLGHYPLQKMFLLRSGKNSGCYGNFF